MQSQTLKSIGQWVASLVLFDAVVLLYILLGCTLDPEMCGVGGTFVLGFFYGPFAFILPDLGATNGLDNRTFAGPMLGILLHVLIGVYFGYAKREKRTTWIDSIITGLGIFLLVIPISLAFVILSTVLLM